MTEMMPVNVDRALESPRSLRHDFKTDLRSVAICVSQMLKDTVGHRRQLLKVWHQT